MHELHLHTGEANHQGGSTAATSSASYVPARKAPSSPRAKSGFDALKSMLFWAALVVPHLTLIVMDPWAYLEGLVNLKTWLKLSADHASVWLRKPEFWAAAGATAVERISYAWIWTHADAYKRFCKSVYFVRQMGTPMDILCDLFFLFKFLQIVGLSAWYFQAAPALDLRDLSLLRLVTGVQLFVMGQVLNVAIYLAIGKAGVYYGCRLGHPVPWCEGFPFSVIRHPQYVGVLMTLVGALVLCATEPHAEEGILGLLLFQACTYSWTMYIEDYL